MRKTALVMAFLLLASGFAVPFAQQSRNPNVSARLEPGQEVPAVSSVARGHFKATIDDQAQQITYELTYSDLEGSVTQAHIHLGQRGANGGVMVFLCANPPITPPAGTPACPETSGTVSGLLIAADVIGPAAQGIDPGEFDEVVRNIRLGLAYANVHSTKFPGGEIRGQLEPGRGHR
jgi:hypothetical protein